MDPTQELPPELWIEIMGHATMKDVLRLGGVNRTIRGLILASPLIQYKIDLFAIGAKYNPAAGMSANSRKSLLRYQSKLYSPSPAEKKTVHNVPMVDRGHVEVASGVLAVLGRDSVRLLVLGSASRGIEQKKWEIPRPAIRALETRCCLDPHADVIAFVGLQEIADMRIEIHLRAMSDGSQHPEALCPTIQYSWKDARVGLITTVSITSSRLVVLGGQRHLVVWDWKSAQVLFELEESWYYRAAEFVDDHLLLVALEDEAFKGPPSLVLMDTQKDVEGRPTQTFFCLSDHFTTGVLSLRLERGGHKPSPMESSAPFYHDSAQRIIALRVDTDQRYAILLVDDLLTHLESHEGSNVEWEDWKACLVIPSARATHLDMVVSGCRLFAIYATISSYQMKVYDFSMQGRAKYLSERPNGDLGVMKHMSATGARVRTPWCKFNGMHSGHGSIVFPNYSHRDGYSMHIWTY